MARPKEWRRYKGNYFIAAEDSPTGQPLLAVGNEVSGSITVYEIEVAE